MRRFLTFHWRADVVGDYPDASAVMIGGTVPAMTPKAAAKFLARFTRSDEKTIFHITLSMPKGMSLSDDEWLAVIRHVLAASGLPPDLLPWIAIGRENASCDHVHVFGALSTFAGRPLERKTSVAFTDALQLDLCHRLDLPEPPALQLAARRCSEDGEGLSTSKSFPITLENAFHRFRPKTVRALNAALHALSPRWAMVTTEKTEELLILDRQTGGTSYAGNWVTGFERAAYRGG